MIDSAATPPFTNPKVRTLLLYFLLFSFLLGIILVGLQTVFNINVADPLWTILIYIVLFVLLSVWLRQQYKRHGIQLRFVLGRKPEQPSWLVMAGLVVAALLFSLSSFTVGMSILSYTSPEVVEALLQTLEAEARPQTEYGLLFEILNAIAAIIVAPITEEFIFRGFILQRWAVKWNLPLALMVSSLLFGVLHLNAVGLTMFGLVMGLFYIKTRSLFVPIAGHMLNNIIATASTYLPIESESTSLATLRANLPIGIGLMLFSLFWLVRFISKNFPRRDAPIPYVVNAQKSVIE